MARLIVITILLVGYIILVGMGAGVVYDMHRSQSTTDLYSGVLVVESADGQGSCFVVAQKNDYWYAITAAHVVETPAYASPDLDRLSITVDDEAYEIEIVRVDSDADIALIRFKSPEKYRMYQLASTYVGESCIAVGWSQEAFLRYPGSVITLNFKDFIAANGGIVPGCSGGPLLNKAGRVIGITVQIATYRGRAFDSTALYVPARYAVALLIGSGVREF